MSATGNPQQRRSRWRPNRDGAMEQLATRSARPVTEHRQHAQRDAQSITPGGVLNVDDETFRHVGIEITQLDELVDNRADRKQSRWCDLGIRIPPSPDMHSAGNVDRLQAKVPNEVEDATAQVERGAAQRQEGSADCVRGRSVRQVE